MSAKLDPRVYPVTAWRFTIGSSGGDQQVALLQIAYAKDVGEVRAAAAGVALKNMIPLVLTARQCRRLAANLVEAANKLDGGSGPKQ